MDIKTLTGIYDSNTYCIDNRLGTLIIDCGIEFDQLKKTLDKSTKPINVLLTHGHFDHVHCAAKLCEYGATIYIHKMDSDRLSQGDLTLNLGRQIESLKNFVEIENDQELNLSGFNIQVICTPGHTQGSVCYVVNGNIFTGDTLFFQDCGRTDLPGGNQAQIEQSLKKLFRLDGELVVYPGHDKTTTIAHEREYFKKQYGLTI
jgi:glyoxylase-like metal-dependent hydrolase (beta-lactamase superfamily II)